MALQHVARLIPYLPGNTGTFRTISTGSSSIFLTTFQIGLFLAKFGVYGYWISNMAAIESTADSPKLHSGSRKGVTDMKESSGEKDS